MATDDSKGELVPVSTVEDILDSLPEGLRQQISNGLVDVSNLTPEQMRGIINNNMPDGHIGDLAFAGRSDSTGNWKAELDSGASPIVPLAKKGSGEPHLG